MAVIETWLTQDLKEPVQVQHLCGSFFSHNGNANRIGVKVFDNGSAASLSGTVSGYAVIEDGTTVPCTGSLSGNQASVLLPAAAYVPGNVCVTIMMTSGTTVTTLAALVATVVEARTDTQVDPGSVVTDWTNTINAALQTVENYTGNIIATPYASLTYPVPLGKYCIYNNLLYRCISPISSSESWTSSHWVQTKLADDVSDLKSALGEDSPNLIELPDAVIDKTSSYNVKVITSTDGKVRVEGVKSTSGSGIITLTSVFYVPAGDYYFGSRRGVLGGIYFQLRESSSTTTPTDAGSIAAETGFKKITIATGKYAFVRLALHGSDTYVGSTELYPELVPVNNSEVFTPGGLIANDPIARITNTNENYGFISLFTQKRIAVIGDSISSYNNQKYCGNYVYYYPSPLIPDVDSTEKTWWMRVANASGSVIAFNESEAGAYATNQRPDGRIDFYARVEALYARNVSPDLIFVALGTNDSVNSVAIGDYDFTSSIADLAEDTFRPAYTKGIKDLQYRFPNAEIVCLIFQMDDDYAESITHIAYRLGCKVINSKVYTTGSSVHPNEMGMRQIASTILLNAEKNAITMNWSSGASDLNDYKEPGMYILPSRTDYSNLPSDVPYNPSQAMQLLVYGYTEQNYRIQRLYFTSGNTVAHYREYIRVMQNTTWNNWVKVYDLDAENAFKNTMLQTALRYTESTTATDLNDLDEPCFAVLPSALVKTEDFDPHLPDEVATQVTAKHIVVYRKADSDYLIQRLYITGGNTVAQYREFVRVRNSATNWNPWREVYNKADFDTLMEKIAQADNTVSEYTDDTFTGTTGYTGAKLRFLSYNVANYNKDTSVYISDEKRTNFKKMLSDVQADFIGLQEENSINGVSEGSPGYESSHDYIYAPVYPVEYGTTTCSLKSKISATTNYSVMRYPTYKPDGQDDPTVGYRWLRAAIFTVNNKRVLVCSTHPVANQTVNGEKTGGDSAHSIAARAQQYEAMFKWVTRYVDPVTSEQYALERVTPAGQFVTCGEWDYCVICGDMNCSTADDKTNLKTLAETYGFSMANGGWLGWLETCRNAAGTIVYSLDNVIVSSNVVITGVRSCKSLYPDLYSDHYPLVVDVVLKD